ncbi:MAG: hypothetical protein ACTSWY_09210 [Promethearchaeota archaeon]
MKKATQLQKRRESKAGLMKELEGLESIIGNLENRISTQKPKPRPNNRQNVSNLENIVDRWKDINNNPPQKRNKISEETLDFIEEEEKTEQIPSLRFGGISEQIIEDLELCVLNQIKACIQLIVSQSEVGMDPMTFSLVQGTCKSIDDYEKLYSQLKIMTVMQKFKQDHEKSEIIAFILSNLN